eukprot:TRINITY_DN9696_c0_g1_i1.p1 TRINITY_DN9696_c0_g1~~TRINITY_DN9696_c0_g1_i1.p1  ORF type:complete len:215 (+),score=43.97 TRINITY_DN9696_c0_g1_i1:133-777(+)
MCIRDRIWDTEELLVSMDAILMWRPWREHPQWQPSTEGLHLDQNPFKKPDLCCVQGMLVLEDVTQEIGGLQVIPGSHLPEAKAQLKRNRAHLKNRGDWCVLGEPEPGQRDAALVLAEAGDLILWDSRTVHGGVVGPGLCGDTDPCRLARMAVPVCMTPRAWASEDALKERQRAFKKGLVLSHWPHERVGSGGHMGAWSNQYVPIELTQEQRDLL